MFPFRSNVNRKFGEVRCNFPLFSAQRLYIILGQAAFAHLKVPYKPHPPAFSAVVTSLNASRFLIANSLFTLCPSINLFLFCHKLHYGKAIHNIFHPPSLLPVFVQNADDLLVASAECPSDDEDLEECEPGNGESAQGVSFSEKSVPRSKNKSELESSCRETGKQGKSRVFLVCKTFCMQL